MKPTSTLRRSRGFTLIELLVVISIVAALAALSFAGVTAALRKAKTTEGRVAASALAQAVNAFYSEYNRLPELQSLSAPNGGLTNGGQGVQLLQILLAQEDAANNPINSRGVNFLSIKEAKSRVGGLDYGPQGNAPQVQGLYDPFGQPFTVVLNTEYQNVLTFQLGDRTYNLRGEQVAVYSPGADEQLGTQDDITSFQR
jgi:prepilin-type N-terminal cleavage/methylation domain-containing protein